ncbi:MAG: hypothetical protein RIC03_00235 [Cyclobacteriaceae bacterium]
MNNQKSPTWFLVVAIVMVVWNLMGVAAFIVDITTSEEAIAALPAAERELYGKFPVWTKVAYFIAVFAGTLGAIGLVLKKKWAKPVLIVSLVGVIVQMLHSLFIADSMEVYGPGAVVMPVMVILFGIFLVWMANYGIKKGWLV